MRDEPLVRGVVRKLRGARESTSWKTKTRALRRQLRSTSP
jgi:hypothetical protein